MQKIRILLLAMVNIYAGLHAGCIIAVPFSCSMERISGSGTVVTQVREVPEFDRIHLEGTGRVFLSQDNVTTLSIKTDDNIMPLIKSVVNDSVLEISHESYSLKPTTLEFYLTTGQLRGISISGSGDVVGQSLFKMKEFEAVIKGSGDMVLTVDTKRLVIEIKGSGSMDLTGEADDFQASIRGSGDIRAHRLVARHAAVSIAGSGNCQLRGVESLRADISGSGDVIYGGRPRVESHIRGSGSVKASD